MLKMVIILLLSCIISIVIMSEILNDCFAAANWSSQFIMPKNVNTKNREKES